MTRECVSFTCELTVKISNTEENDPIFNTFIVLVCTTGNKYNLALFYCSASVLSGCFGQGWPFCWRGGREGLFIIEIMPEVKLGPEVQPRDANNRVVLFLLDT